VPLLRMRRRRQLPTPRDRSGRFVNWSGTESSTPSAWLLPTSEAEVLRQVGAAAEQGRRIRVVGAGHSFSPLAVPEDQAMSLDRLEGPILIGHDRRTVTVPGGVRLRDLSATLLRAGLSLPIVGSIQAQSVAGAIATGTHGSSLAHGNLATLVTSLRLVTSSGEVLQLDEGDERLHGARVHLGALGVVTAVTLRVREAVRLHQRVEHVPVEAVAAALPRIAASADYVKVWWLPHAPVAQVVRYAVTNDPTTRRLSPATQRWVDENLMHRVVFPAMIRRQHRRPEVTAGINRRLAKVYLGAASQVGQDSLMLNTPMPVRHRETEAALPLTAAAQALDQVLAIFRDGRPAVNFPLEVRFVRGDDSWLSPAYGADACQIGAYTTDGPDCASYFDAFWKVMRPLGARPHWGKELDFDAAELRAAYPEFDRFLALRDTLDPARVFANAFQRRVLG
jgi:FAD-linked oxidoreductase